MYTYCWKCGSKLWAVQDGRTGRTVSHHWTTCTAQQKINELVAAENHAEQPQPDVQEHICVA